jgi:hypothetical protein
MGGKKEDKTVAPQVVFDFSKMDPQNDEEADTYKRTQGSLGDGPQLLDHLKVYGGCEEPIRKVKCGSFSVNQVGSQ